MQIFWSGQENPSNIGIDKDKIEIFQHLGSVVTNYGYSDWATTEIPAVMLEKLWKCVFILCHGCSSLEKMINAVKLGVQS